MARRTRMWCRVVTLLRDWFPRCASTPMGHRESGRIALAHRVRQDFAAAVVSADPDEAERLVDRETCLLASALEQDQYQPRCLRS